MLLVLLLAMEVMFVGSNTLNKAATAKGMSNYVYITYTHAIDLLILIPASFLYHRNRQPPPIGCSTILRMLLIAILNSGCSIFFYTGLRYSSPTLASAMSNLSLPFTFIVASIFRMEILNLRSQSTLLKLIETIVSISGAFIVIFYQGLPISSIFPSPTNPSLHSFVELQTQPNWILGGTFLSMCFLLVSFAYATKTWLARDYPSEVLITLITFFFETIIVLVITLIAENDSSVWKPTYGIEYISILVGAVSVGTINIVDTWACRVKGPVFVAMFKPLQMIIAVIMGALFLGDVLHLGSVIGGLIIAIGFYMVIKGKAEEDNMLKKVVENKLTYSIQEEESHTLKIPMLLDKSMDA